MIALCLDFTPNTYKVSSKGMYTASLFPILMGGQMVPFVEDMSSEKDLSVEVGGVSIDEGNHISWNALMYKRETSAYRLLKAHLRMQLPILSPMIKWFVCGMCTFLASLRLNEKNQPIVLCGVTIGLYSILMIVLITMILCFLACYDSFVGGLSRAIKLISLGALLVGVGC